jgi:hypothetical protein
MGLMNMTRTSMDLSSEAKGQLDSNFERQARGPGPDLATPLTLGPFET